MNKSYIAKELDEYVKDIDSFFRVNDDGDLNLLLGEEYIAAFRDFKSDKFMIFLLGFQTSKKVIETEAIKKFYDKAVDILRKNEKNYTVKVIKGDEGSYLNYSYELGKYIFSDDVNGKGYKTRFRKSQIKALKQRDDIAIDWNKAIIKEVK